MRTRSTSLALACGLAALAAIPTARAADLPMLATTPTMMTTDTPWWTPFYVHVGVTGLIPDAGAKIDLLGIGRLPGASIKVPPQVTASVEVGYRFTPNWAVSLAGGSPPTADIYGSGTVAAIGKFGSLVAGPVALTGHYHFTNFGRFQPYIGGGVTYLIAFNSRDAAVNDLQVRSAWGAVGQVGADYMITDHLGVFIDYKKAYLRTSAVGLIFGAPFSAKVKLDPSAVSGGLTYRF